MQPEQKVVGRASKKSHPKSSRKKIAIILIVVGILLVSVIYGGSVLLVDNQCRGKSGSELYARAIKAIDESNSAQLRSATQEIRKQRNYEADPNCMYPLVAQSINNEQFEDARTHYKKIEESVKEGKVFVDEYKKVGVTSADSVLLKINSAEYIHKSPSGASVLLF